MMNNEEKEYHHFRVSMLHLKIAMILQKSVEILKLECMRNINIYCWLANTLTSVLILSCFDLFGAEFAFSFLIVFAPPLLKLL